MANAGRHEVDDVTLHRARCGQQSALEAVVLAHQNSVYRLIARILAQRSDLWNDTAQDVFLKVIKNLHRFDPNGPAKLSTWILTIATRTCLDLLRRKRVTTETLDDQTAPDTGSSPAAVAQHRELGQQVQHIMSDMPDQHRVILVLRAYHDLSYQEIADLLEVERGTVKSRLNRARQFLRSALERRARRTE